MNFGKRKEECESHKRNIKFFFKYLKPYQRQVGLLLLGMLLGSLLQLVFPFLTQALVDRGVNGKNLGFVTLILIAQLVLGVFLLGNTLYILWVAFFMKYRRELDYKRFSQSATERNKMIQLIQGYRTIRVEHVTFSYDGAERNYALNDVSLEIPERKVTAIVGESGCGKTTLIKLLQGFYQPNHGSIKVGNLPLTSINPHFWRSVTGSVMQESFIFSDTFAHNIALDSDSLDETRLYQAAKMANVDGFIRTLPLGYHTKIGMEGNGVSQGQRQRLLIARAIYKNPEYIFFDEATNALDTTNESEIMHHLYEFYHGRTVVVAAHRLSTVKNADQIVVIDQGKVVEVGNHESLTAKHGAYYNLVKNQLELGN